jgi:hypothetical protein
MDKQADRLGDHQTNGKTDKQTNRQAVTDGQTTRSIDKGKTDRQTNRPIEKRENRQDRQLDKWTNGQTDRQPDQQTSGQTGR